MGSIRWPVLWRACLGMGIVAILASGGVRGDETNKEDRKTRRDAAEKKDRPVPFPDIDELMKRLPPGLNEGQVRIIRMQLEAARRQVEAALQLGERFRGAPVIRGRGPNTPSRMGARLSPPSPAMIEQLDLPAGRGMVVEDPGRDSPASKAGLKVSDILLEVDGKPVPSQPREFAQLERDIKANAPVDVVVMRKGKKESIKGLTLPVAEEPRRPMRPVRPVVGRRPVLPGRAGGSMLSMQRSGDQVTIREQEGTTGLTLTATLKDGKLKVEQVQVQSGREAQRYDSIDKAPMEHQARLKALAELAVRSGPAKKPNAP